MVRWNKTKRKASSGKDTTTSSIKDDDGHLHRSFSSSVDSSVSSSNNKIMKQTNKKQKTTTEVVANSKMPSVLPTKRGGTKEQQEPPPPPQVEPIPVTLLSGFLGSGKTTLLRHILTSKDHNLKIAVIVNDMAELNIDGQDIITTRTSKKSQKKKKKKEVITLQNGCICCTLRGDLIREIYNIQQQSVKESGTKFDYVLIESTGIAEPQQVAESFCVDPTTQQVVFHNDDEENEINHDGDHDHDNGGSRNKSTALFNSARLDTCVTVVDAVNFPQYLSSLERFKDVFDDGLAQSDGEENEDEDEGAFELAEQNEAEGQKSISELMIEQVEFANVIVLNKIDLVPNETVEIARRLITALNPRAKVVTSSFGNIPLDQILNTHMFNMKDARESPGWLQSLSDSNGLVVQSEADEYGVGSFVFRARTPFHPLRLYNFIKQFFQFAEEWNGKDDTNSTDSNERNNHIREDSKRQNEAKLQATYGSILRSKGTVWIAGRDDHEMAWHQTGKLLQLNAIGSWYCNVPNPNDWDGGETPEGRKLIESKFYHLDTSVLPHKMVRSTYGDRRQELVIIGTNLQQKAIEDGLQSCLLNDTEMAAYATNLPIGTYPDPLIPVHIPCTGAQSLFLIARQGQSQHLRLYPGFSTTIHSMTLNVTCPDEVVQSYKSVKVWLDKSEDHHPSHGILLATFRPDVYEQHSICLPLLPCDEQGGEERTNRRIRVEVVPKSTVKTTERRSKEEMMLDFEVHIMGKIEPLPYSGADDDEDEEEEGGGEENDYEVNDLSGNDDDDDSEMI